MTFCDETEQNIQALAASVSAAAADRQAAPGNEPCISIVGGGTKPSLHVTPAPERVLSSESLRGIIEYDPAEFTITAYAGTPLRELINKLAEHGQYLPFDPPLFPGDSGSGSTLGGAIAAGINGPGRWRYGGIRDFITETRFIDGTGALRTAGRRVVKNAAGFDIPKLMVGSCGRLGMLVDVTLKVFPQPQDSMTLHVFCENLEMAVSTVASVAMAPWEIDALEIQPDTSLLIRLTGEPEVLSNHGSRLQAAIKQDGSSFLVGAEQQQVWDERGRWLWGNPEEVLIRVPLNLRVMLDLDEDLDELEIERCFGSAGNVAWLKWCPPAENPGTRLKRLVKLIKQYGLQGMIVRRPDSLAGMDSSLLVGAKSGHSFYQKLKQVFDPHHLYGDFHAS